MLQTKLLEQLKQNHKGIDRAIKSKYLAAQIGVSNRKLRQLVNQLRCQGEPICSGDGGYFYAGSKEELMLTIRQLQSRIQYMNSAIKGLRFAKKRFEGQALSG